MDPIPEKDQIIGIRHLFDPKRYKVTVNPQETPLELKSRVAREDADASLRRIKELLLFVVATLGVVTISLLCVWAVVRSSSTPDDKKWATSILSSIVAGAIGYLFGKASKA